MAQHVQGTEFGPQHQNKKQTNKNKQINKTTKTNQSKKTKKPTSHPTTKLQCHLTFYSVKGKARHTCWLPFLLLPVGINTTSASLPLQEERNLLICQGDPFQHSIIKICHFDLAAVGNKGDRNRNAVPWGPSKSHNTTYVRSAFWLTTHILSSVGASMAFTVRVYPAARHKLGLFRLKIQEGRW